MDYFRLEKKRCEFQQIVKNLVGSGDSAAAVPRVANGDGLGEELQEAVRTVLTVLRHCREGMEKM